MVFIVYNIVSIDSNEMYYRIEETLERWSLILYLFD